MRYPSVALAVFCLIGHAFHAQPPPSSGLVSLGLEDLMNIRVTTVSRRPERLSDAAVSIFVITRDEIRRSGATSLPEALRLAPNLHVAQVSSSGFAISSRGFNASSANNCWS